jgi:aminoglycoside phosphotransferase (APT) family kinase protein
MLVVERELSSAVARHLGPPGTVGRLTRLTGGATRVTWSFEAAVGDTVRQLILQQSGPRHVDPSSAFTRLPQVWGTGDAQVLRAAARAGVRVAPVRFAVGPDDGMDHGVVTDFVAGETIGQRIIREPRLSAARDVMARQCGENLAAIHRIDPRGLEFLLPHGPAEQVALYAEIFHSYDWPQPAIEYGLRWAAEHAPRDHIPAFVHGDFRTGNFIVGEDGIRAVLDWEIAHLGDPMEDLGWLCVRTWRFGGRAPVGGFGQRETLFAAYEQASGRHVDPERVRFWEAFGSVKWAIMCAMKGHQHLRGAPLEMEQLAIGRRAEEPVWDFLNLVHGDAR